MKDKIGKVLLSYDVEFSNDSTYSERGIRREDYSELAEELVKLFLIPPVISSVCDIHKCTRCEKSFPSYSDGKCRECGGQAN